MIAPLDELLERLEPWRSRDLFSDEALERVRAVARTLPPEITGSIGLEARLRAGESRVDFMFFVLPNDEGHEALSSYRRLFPQGPLTGPLWEGVFAFCAAWANPASELYGRVPSMALEFDLDEPPTQALQPFAFACVQPGFGKAPLSMWRTTDEHRRTARRSLELLAGGPLAPAVARTVDTCFEQLPKDAHMLHVAPLAARGSEAVRLVLTLRWRDLGEYLSRVGWQGSRQEVEALAADPRMGFASYVDLNLDAGERVGPQLGFYIQLPESADDPRTRLLLEPLVEQGQCTPPKREAVLRWPGSERAVLAGHRWPCQLARTLDIKLVHRPGEPLEAKVYAYFESRFALFGRAP